MFESVYVLSVRDIVIGPTRRRVDSATISLYTIEEQGIERVPKRITVVSRLFSAFLLDLLVEDAAGDQVGSAPWAVIDGVRGRRPIYR